MRKNYLAIMVLLTISLAVAGSAWGKEYGHYEVSKIVTIATSKSGSNQATVNLRNIDDMISDLTQHARNYPPHFDSAEDAQRARTDIANALKLLGVFAANPQLPPQILLRIARLGNLGNNLDVPGAGQEAIANYSRLLTLAPQNAELNFEYGQFLASTPQLPLGIPYLEKAKSLGVANADYSLALAYTAVGNQKMALLNIESYLKRVPADANAAKIRDAIRTGHVTVKRTP